MRSDMSGALGDRSIMCRCGQAAARTQLLQVQALYNNVSVYYLPGGNRARGCRIQGTDPALHDILVQTMINGDRFANV